MAVLFISLIIKAQVGINNTSPKATLDITAKTTDGSKPEGLIAPRLTGDQIQSGTYGSAQLGAIIYATAAASAPTAVTANITSSGYYYFDGSAWQKMTGAAAGDTTNDAWINDTTNGMVKLGNKADGTARAAGTDFVAKDNGQVGIGTNSPGNRLHVSAPSDPLRLDGLQTGAKTMNYLVTDTNGVIKTVTPESTNPSNVYVFVKMGIDHSATYSSNSFSNILVPFDTKVTDTNSAYDITTQTFTAPENGYYLINQVLSMNFDCTGASNTYVYSIVNAGGTKFQSGSYSSDTTISYEGGRRYKVLLFILQSARQ